MAPNNELLFPWQKRLEAVQQQALAEQQQAQDYLQQGLGRAHSTPEDALVQTLIGALPALVGAGIGGKAGFGTGAMAGAEGILNYDKLEKQRRKEDQAQYLQLAENSQGQAKLLEQEKRDLQNRILTQQATQARADQSNALRRELTTESFDRADARAAANRAAADARSGTGRMASPEALRIFEKQTGEKLPAETTYKDFQQIIATRGLGRQIEDQEIREREASQRVATKQLARKDKLRAAVREASGWKDLSKEADDIVNLNKLNNDMTNLSDSAVRGALTAAQKLAPVSDLDRANAIPKNMVNTINETLNYVNGTTNPELNNAQKTAIRTYLVGAKKQISQRLQVGRAKVKREWRDYAPDLAEQDALRLIDNQGSEIEELLGIKPKADLTTIANTLRGIWGK